MFSRDCPCASAAAYDACCGPLHRGTATATSPEQLMRSRFAAYAAGETDYVFRTWHPRTRPDDSPAGPGSLHERSVFEQRGGRWVYVGVAGA